MGFTYSYQLNLVTMKYLINVSNIANVLWESESIQLYDADREPILHESTLNTNTKNHTVFIYGDESTVTEITQ